MKIFGGLKMFEKDRDNINQNKSNNRSEDHQIQDSAIYLYHFISDFTKSILSQVKTQIGENLLPISSEINETSTKCQQIVYLLQTIEKQNEALLKKNNLLENASKENHLLSHQHYQTHIIEPMVRLLFPVFDVIEEAINRWSITTDTNVKKFFNVLEQVRIQLIQFFMAYQIELIKYKPGIEFNPKYMKPVKIVHTGRKELGGRVAECLQIGFRQGEQKILRFVSVVLYEYRPEAADNVAEKKGAYYVSSSNRCG